MFWYNLDTNSCRAGGRKKYVGGWKWREKSINSKRFWYICIIEFLFPSIEMTVKMYQYMMGGRGRPPQMIGMGEDPDGARSGERWYHFSALALTFLHICISSTNILF